jgi:hypothetical protein
MCYLSIRPLNAPTSAGGSDELAQDAEARGSNHGNLYKLPPRASTL